MHQVDHIVAALLSQLGLYECLQAPVVVGLGLLAFLHPRFGAGTFGWIERAITWIAARPVIAAASIALFVVGGRLLLIPFLGTAQPSAPDDGSIMLQAATYLTGHLGNAKLPPDFESIYVVTSPSYASMYPVLRSLPLVVGALIGVGFWGGILLCMAALCVAVYLVLRAWIAPQFAYVAALVLAIRVGFFSFWVNMFYGPAFTALGGVLLIGAYAWIRRRPTLPRGALLGLSVMILMTTRPFEGMLAAAPVGVALVVDFLRSAPAERRAFLSCGAMAGLLVAGGLALTAASNQAVTGNWRETPYDFYRKATASVPAFFVSKRTDPRLSTVRYEQTRAALHLEDKWYERGGQATRLVPAEGHKLLSYWNFYIGFALLAPFLIGLYVLRNQVALLGCLGVLIGGLMLVTWDHPQYPSPATGVFLLYEGAGLMALRRWSPGGRPVGLALSRLLPTALVIGALLPLSTTILGYPDLQFGINNSAYSSCCWIRKPSLRSQIEDRVGAGPNGQMVVVDNGPRADPRLVTVFNLADIARQHVVWIDDDPRYNAAAFAKYPNRTLWWLGWQDDGKPCLTPYADQFGPPAQASAAGAAHDEHPRGRCAPGLFHP
ncbi:MAG TPA: hypothetical protein VHY32_08235 [Caulobacteraceae bacterium]|jgi:hypothetical protein|nr:hypothetical protein [Caulobacteraceae bacterium]